ncbi:DUF2147 domain-containing protein [Marivirga sp. S37H4]|uniref:DUF2147 domain-containing protein n=1 Tax=Marivirga aurantiaca TaxID=2802615 RepID=A0A935C7A8_9BACT|nr:DUF2147 domain-containing protein [Marivirga aurantiaca]MBK6264804.1 DUF2147 domain-containing protein [Marivirga aurantiaca]
MKKIIVLLIFVSIQFNLSAQSDIFGKWKTIDDETGKVKSIVEIYKKDGKAYGKIVKLFRGPDEEQDPICDLCPGDRKNKKIIGLEIIRGMEYDKSDNEWEDGTILDPKNGKTYDCLIYKEGDELKVRGYIAFFYRTQTWKKVD